MDKKTIEAWWCGLLCE